MSPATATHPAATSPATGAKPVILCAEDEKSLLDALEFQLESAFGSRFRIAVAESGRDAMDELNALLAKGNEVAAIISDQMMPGMNGDEFLIAAHQLVPFARKIMLTGQADIVNVTRAINEADLYRYISKPWDSNDLRLTVEKATDSYMADKQIREQNRVLSLLSDSTEAISRSLAVDAMLAELMRILQELSGAPVVTVVVERGGSLMVEGQASPNTPARLGLGIPLAEAQFGGRNLALKVAETQQPIVVRNAQVELGTKDDAYIQQSGSKSLLVIPSLNLGKLVGIICLEHPDAPNFFSDDRIRIINLLATKASIAIENAYLFSSLEGQVAQRTERLQETLQQLMAVNSHKDKIISIVSHDIRSPLSGIGELASNLKDPDIAGDKEEVARFGGIIQKSVSSLLTFVNDILDLAKLESGQVILNPEPTDVGPWMKGLLETHRPQTTAKGINLNLQGETKVQTQLDRSKMAQVVNNLLSNAIKFTPKGGSVTLSYDTAQDGGKDCLRFQVADTGVGIPKADFAAVFEKFTKSQRTGTKGEKGTGLGLSIVKEIVNLHSGRIDVTSDVGQGTTFTVLVPLA